MVSTRSFATFIARRRRMARCLFIAHGLFIAQGLLALAILGHPSVTAAQAHSERARELFEQGVTAMDSGNPALAAEYFNESYQLFPRASTACNMALSLERTGRGCDAESWYRQCAVLDQEGRFRDHANRQASALGAQCQPNQAQNPFVAQATVSTGSTPSNSSGQVQIIEQREVEVRSPSHTLLGVGIAGLVLGGGALAGAIGLASAAQSEREQLVNLAGPGDPANPTPLVPGTPAADHYSQAGTFSSAAIALYAVSGVLGGVSVILILVDLAQPGVFGGSARSDGAGLRFAVAPTEGGAFGQLELRF
jgi:hypothetical protein